LRANCLSEQAKDATCAKMQSRTLGSNDKKLAHKD
jgi:hypothetical protein